jgi:hypothetical protein
VNSSSETAAFGVEDALEDDGGRGRIERAIAAAGQLRVLRDSLGRRHALVYFADRYRKAGAQGGDQRLHL